MGEKLRRRLRVAGPLVAVGAVVGLAAWLGPTFRARKPVGPPAGDASLLVLVRHHGPDGRVDRHELVRVPFTGSEPQPPETVWDGGTRHFYSLNYHRIIDGRYVVDSPCIVIDVWERRVLHMGGGGSDRGVVEANSDRVISGVHTTHARVDLVLFDLKARRARKLSGPEAAPFALPGKRSPDGTRSVSWPALDGHLTLHRVGHAPLPLGRFRTTAGLGSDYAPPALWIDNERVLTQDGNGILIAVALDGTRAPVVNLPVKPELVAPPQLTRDPDGRTVYTCGGEGFLIDADAKTWERYEWGSLGHGFEATWEPHWPGRSTIRYQGKEIENLTGWPHRAGQSASADGRLAIVDAGRQVRVWSAGAGWTTLEVRGDALIGWLK